MEDKKYIGILDSVVIAGLVAILWRPEWRVPIANFWRQTYPANGPVCVTDGIAVNWQYGLITFAMVAYVAKLVIDGELKWLRATSFSCFLAIYLDLWLAETGRISHIIADPYAAAALPVGFLVAVDKFIWFLFLAVGGATMLYLILGALGTLFSDGADSTEWLPQGLVLLKVSAFAQIMMASFMVKKWQDIYYLAQFGMFASLGEAIVLEKALQEEEGVLSRLELVLLRLGATAFFVVVGISGYQVFLAAWQPRFLC